MPNLNNRSAMDINQTEHTLSFGKDTGFYLSRTKALFVAALFISGLVATGLLVYYYAPRGAVGGVQSGLVGHDNVAPEQEIMKGKIEPKKAMPMSANTTTTSTSTTTSSTPTASTEKPPEPEELSIRLPKSLKPMSYMVKLQPFVNGNFSIQGEIEIEMEVIDSTYKITMHISDIITHNDTVKVIRKDDPHVIEQTVKKQEYDPDKEFYIVTMEKPLMQGSIYTFSMSFQGYLNDKLKGFYRSSYKDEEGNERWLAVTQFQATHARKAFPCFDEPGMKATFEIFLAREENMTSLSNMPLAETLPVDDQEGWVWDHFNTSVPMSTYLVAFVVSDFAQMNTSENGTLFRVWARESAIDQAEYSLEIGPSILSHFGDYFNVSYPLPKQDMIALPDFAAGAMENWGLITYRETAMLYEPGVSAPENKHRVALVVAHELAHQWFGNLVTPEWWDDLWLNEGFASFVQYIGMDYVEPTWKVMELFIIEKVQRVFEKDSLESSHRISIPVGHPNEISQIFDSISYEKGASIIRMMNHFLTEASMRKGLTHYLEAFEYENAVQDDLWNYLTMAAHEDGTLPQELTVKEIMDTWTLQMGYPVITVTRNSDGTSATVTQKRFLVTKSNNTTNTDATINEVGEPDYMWWVPLNYASQSNPIFNKTSAMKWMKKTESEVTIRQLPSNKEWVIFNLQETGYYRVNYDENNWNLIIKQLQDNHSIIDTINRAQLIDDAMDLARADLLSYDIALELYSYLGNETEYVPWNSAFNNLDYLLKMFQQTGGYGALKNYVRDLVIPLYDSVGFNEMPGDDLLEQYMRKDAVSWACKLDYQDCVDKAVALYKQWMEAPDNMTIVPPNIKRTVYCKGIEEGDEEEWNFAWKKYVESNVASEKSLLLSALGCTKKIWLLSRYMEMAFMHDSGIRRQDSDAVFSAVADNTVGHSLAWMYLRDNWNNIYAYHGQARSRVISSATDDSNTNQNLKEIEQFHQDHVKDLDAASRTVEQAIENAKNNIDWMENNYKVIVEFLEKKGYSTAISSS